GLYRGRQATRHHGRGRAAAGNGAGAGQGMSPEHLLRLAAFVSLFAAATAVSRAQDYPTQPVRLVVPFPAGGGTDALARWFSKGLEDRLGQPFVVENRAGAGTTLGAGYVATATPDGYTILLGTGST